MLDWPIVQDLLNGPFGRIMVGVTLFVATIGAILRLNAKTKLPAGLYFAMLMAELLVLIGIGFAFWSEGGFVAGIELLSRIDLWITAGFVAVILGAGVLALVFRGKGRSGE